MSRRRGRAALLACAALLLAGAAALPDMGPPAAGDMRTALFAPTAQAFPNPERGFYRPAAPLHEADRADFDRIFAQGARLAYTRIDLESYRDAPLPPVFLDALEKGFAAARAAGVKLIVRATYNYPQGETDYQWAEDAPLPLVLQHIAQLQPLLAANEDVVAFVQAGFIGAWGEWHSSSNGLTTPEARARVRDALLAAVPASRFVQFRYPPDLVAWRSAVPSSAFTRIGFHNDCFLASQTDVGTYPAAADEREAMQARMAALSSRAPFGGETCNPADDPGAVARTDCADILREGARYHLTYLNASYYRRMFHDGWAEQGCLDAVARRMGYRFTLLDASAGAEAQAGATWRIDLAVRNDGWARHHTPRRLEVLLLPRQGGGPVRLSAAFADPRQWLPGRTARMALGLVVPTDLPAGMYEVALALPDAGATLHGDPRYAIRFANADVPARGQRWDDRLGAFRTGLALGVR